MACGIPLICSTWHDAENLFTPGKDYLLAHNGKEMKQHMKTMLEDKEAAGLLAEHALSTIHKRHTCGHRANEFLKIAEKTRQATKLIA